MSHGCGRCSSVPMLLSRREPNHISGVNFLYRTAFPLSPSATCCDDQCLSERMGMPGGARSRFKCDAGSANERRVGCLEKRVNTDSSGKPVCRTFAGRLRTNAFDVHHEILMVRGRSKLEPIYPVITGSFAASHAVMPPASSITLVMPYWLRMLTAIEDR
jgi:hypothetical protein